MELILTVLGIPLAIALAVMIVTFIRMVWIEEVMTDIKGYHIALAGGKLQD